MGASDVGIWLLVWAVTLVVNVVPAFMPPTWSVLAYFRLREDLAIWPLAATGATAATGGRALLALGSRALGPRVVPRAWRANVETLGETLRARKELGLPALVLFTLSPMPSNHLFIAAGLARAPLLPILAVFAIGRFVTYLLWVGAADTAAASLSDAAGPRTGGWVGAATQIVGFAVLVAVMRLDWGRLLRRFRPPEEAVPPVQSQLGTREK